MEANHLASSRSRHVKRNSLSNDEGVSLASTPSPDTRLDKQDQYGVDKRLDSVGSNRNWSAIFPGGSKPRARYYHAAAVVGRKMLVVGGDSDLGMLNDVQQLHLGKLAWSELKVGSSSKEGLLKAKAIQQFPSCRGHSLIAWGKTLLLVSGEMDVPNEKVTVWSFDLESESWSELLAKGEIPIARIGHSVTRAGSVLILFGGEDSKGRKMNDLHMFDLKSLMWLPLYAMGTTPSPRAKHVAAMYDDRFLLVFGGSSKSKVLNDLYALDFETMEWSRLKTRGVSPGPRSECAAVLFGDRWYIVGGDCHGVRCLETLMLDVARMTWSLVSKSNVDSPLASQGFSLVLVQRKERAFLVAYGGKRPGPANEVQVLHIPPPDEVSPRRAALYNDVPTSSPNQDEPRGLIPLQKGFQSTEDASTQAKGGNKSIQCMQWKVHGENNFHDDAQIQVPKRHERKISQSGDLPPLSSCAKDSSLIDSGCIIDKAGMKRDENSNDALVKDSSSSLSKEDTRWVEDAGIKTASLLSYNSDSTSVSLKRDGPNQHTGSLSSSKTREEDAKAEIAGEAEPVDYSEDKSITASELKKIYEQKLAASLRKNAILEGQLTNAVKSREEAEENLSAVLKSRKKTEKRLAAALKEIEDLKEKVAVAELAQEESNSLSNVVHAENVRLEHDLAFLKAVLEDTQKELHTTRGVLAGERSRAFQLQVELFELKQATQGSN